MTSNAQAQRPIALLRQRDWSITYGGHLAASSTCWCIATADPRDGRSPQEVLRPLLGTVPPPLVILSHHTTLREDATVVNDLRKRGATIVGIDAALAEVAYDKRAMSAIASHVRDVFSIPELSPRQARERLARSPIVRKDLDDTEGRSFSCAMDAAGLDRLLNDYDPRRSLLQPFLRGIEFSVVVLSDGRRSHTFEPVYKGENSTLGTHPARRPRFVPHPNVPVELAQRLRQAGRSACQAFGAQGLIELEFIVVEHAIHFLEINPRIAATMRMTALASERCPFDLLPLLFAADGLRQESDYVTKRFAAEVPLPPSVSPQDAHERLAGEPDITITSRVTFVAPTFQGIQERMGRIQAVLERQ